LKGSHKAGILLLDHFDHQTVLDSYERLLSRYSPRSLGKHLSNHPCSGRISWVVSYASPLVKTTDFLPFIPEFIILACLAYQKQKKKPIGKAIIEASLPSVRSGIMVLFQVRSSTFPSVFHILQKVNGRPWGLTLPNCPTCQTNHYLEANAHPNSLTSNVTCIGCCSEGNIDHPMDWKSFWVPYNKKEDGGLWIVNFPEPEISINWKKEKTRALTLVECKSTPATLAVRWPPSVTYYLINHF
jgi:hypothetical protein